MLPVIKLRRTLQTAMAAMSIVAISGCAAFDMTADKSLTMPTDTEMAKSPSISMEIRASGEKKPRIEQVAAEAGSTVQQTLEKTKLTKEFRRMDIQVVRMVGDQRARMDVKYDHTKAQVDPLYDYALYPGDYVIVQEVTKTALDDMLESLTGPLGRAPASPAPRRYRTM